MRTAMSLVSLLVLLMATRAQAIRLLEENSISASVTKRGVHEKWSFKEEEGIASKEGECGSHGHCSGKFRKLTIDMTGTSKSKRSNEIGVDIDQSNPQHDKEEAGRRRQDSHLATPLPPISKNKRSFPDHILDIAGMDYSHAKRKSPIHN